LRIRPPAVRNIGRPFLLFGTPTLIYHESEMGKGEKYFLSHRYIFIKFQCEHEIRPFPLKSFVLLHGALLFPLFVC
jgi:hypothetical protein